MSKNRKNNNSLKMSNRRIATPASILKKQLSYFSTDGKKVSKPKSKDQAKTRSYRKRLNKLQDQALIKGSPRVFKTVLNSLLPNEISLEQLELAMSEIISAHNEMIKNHSVVEGTARFATIRLYCIQLLEGLDVVSPVRVAVGKKDRWPSIFNNLRPFYYRVRDHKCVASDQIIRSLLYMNRLCAGNSMVDTTEIVKTFTVSEGFKSRYREFLKSRFPNDTHGELISKPTLKVTSSGPNSKPKWQTADVEAYALVHSEYAPHFEALCSATGNKDLYDYVVNIANSQTRQDRVRLRYIISIPDKGNKSRVVAISDYWTQTLLEPIMADVKSWTDLHYGNVVSSSDHNLGFRKLKNNIRAGIKSYDIKSWTDAHPHVLQHIWMEHRYGKTIADAWLGLVVTCSWDVKGSKTPVRYGRGQGMGTAGSFDIATATDISIIDMIYLQDYKKSLDETLANKVGDDLWCWDPDELIAHTFTSDMGMEISIPKSKSAMVTNHVAEFVSRNLNYGKDVSRISANICRAVQKNPLDLPELMRHLSDRIEIKPIKIKQVLLDSGVKVKLHTSYIRTFYALCKIYPDRPGSRILMYSLINDYLDLIQTDEFICSLKTNLGLEKFKNSYYLYSGSKLLDTIVEKAEQISSDVKKFESLTQVQTFSDPAKWWLELDESIELKTSKLALAESLDAHSAIFENNTDPEAAIARLERIDRSLTYKELGVISTTRRPLRPTTTRLFNIAKSVVIRTTEECESSLIEYNQDDLTVSNKVITISIDMENRVMLPSVTEKYLGIRGLPRTPNDF